MNYLFRISGDRDVIVCGQLSETEAADTLSRVLGADVAKAVLLAEFNDHFEVIT